MNPLRTVATKTFLEHRHLPQALHQPLSCFQQPHYLANLVQGFLGLLGELGQQTIVIGGDGQPQTQEFLQLILKIAAAKGFQQIIIGSQGLLSPVMMSHLIRHHQAIAGILLTSETHEEHCDLHLDFYGKNGQIAPQSLLEALQERSQIIKNYALLDIPDLQLARSQILNLENLVVQVVNSAILYRTLLTSVFDLELIRDYWGKTLLSEPRSRFNPLIVHCFDAVNYAYAQFILEKSLGFPPATVIYANTSPKFNALTAQIDFPLSHPTTNFSAVLTRHRYGIFGSQLGVTASDSLAILTANAALIPAYRGKMQAVTRSQLTSVAVDHVCASLDINCYETPSQWEFLGDGLDIPEVAFVGNELGEIGANYSRERDGLWAILFWLNICALRQESVETVLQSHWLKYGRNYHYHHRYDQLPMNVLYQFWDELQTQELSDQSRGNIQVAYCKPLKYYDQKQFQLIDQWCYCVGLTDGSRLVFALESASPTGEKGNLNLYLESYEPNPEQHQLNPITVLEPLKSWAESLPCFQILTKGLYSMK